MTNEIFIPTVFAFLSILGVWKLLELVFLLGKWSYKVEQAIEELYKRRQERKHQ